MGPLDTSTLVLSILLAIGAVVGCLLLWSRIPGPNAVKAVGRIGMISTCQITAILMLFLLVNIRGSFYATWNDLAFDLGIGANPNAGAQNGIQPGENNGSGGTRGQKGTDPQINANFRFQSDTKTYKAVITGPASGISGEVDVWLPPGYDPKNAVTKYPVLELFPGTPGTPIAWFSAHSGIRVGKQAGDLMSSDKIKAFIIVAVNINIVRGTPNECTDVPGQAKVATWLTKDVRQLMTEHFHVRTEAKSWGMMGYSEGAYCAVKLGLQFPQMYHTAVGIAGSYRPDLSRVTGDTKVVKATSPYRLVKERPSINLLFATSAQDRVSPPSASASLIKEAKPPTMTNRYVLSHGGHLTSIWGTMMPKILPQLATWLNEGGDRKIHHRPHFK